MDERETQAMQLACAGWVLSSKREQDAEGLHVGHLRLVWEASWQAAFRYHEGRRQVLWEALEHIVAEHAAAPSRERSSLSDAMEEYARAALEDKS